MLDIQMDMLSWQLARNLAFGVKVRAVPFYLRALTQIWY